VNSRKHWRSGATFVSLLAAATALAACSSGTGANTERGEGEGAVEAPSEDVTITFQVTDAAMGTTMDKFVKDFEEEYPTITVELQKAPTDAAAQKLTTQIAGGNPPDVAYVDAASTADFASRNALVNLDDYIERSDIVKPDDYVDAFRTFVSFEDSMYGLPFNGESTGLFYRTDLFEEAGIDGPPKTWEEFEATAAKLTDPAKGQYGYEIFAPEAGYYWYPWLYQAGGDILSADGEILFTSPEAQKAAEFYVGLADYSPPDYLNSNSYDGRVAFIQGQVGMYMAGAWFAGVLHSEAPQIDDKWATAPLPNGDAGCKTTIAGDALLMVANDQNSDEEVDAAWLWMEYLSQPDILAEWTYGSPDGTNLPPLTSLLEGEELVEEKPVLEGFAELMKCGVASEVSNPKAPQIEEVLNEELAEAIYGNQTAQEALERSAQQAQEILDK